MGMNLRGIEAQQRVARLGPDYRKGERVYNRLQGRWGTVLGFRLSPDGESTCFDIQHDIGTYMTWYESDCVEQSKAATPTTEEYGEPVSGVLFSPRALTLETWIEIVRPLSSVDRVERDDTLFAECCDSFALGTSIAPGSVMVRKVFFTQASNDVIYYRVLDEGPGKELYNVL